MIGFFARGVISIVWGAIGAIGVYNYLPLSWFESSQPLGATITTIQGTDTLKDSRTTINTNFSNLNTDLVNLQATTSMFLITNLPNLATANSLTSASSLATVGTITSGTWNGNPIGVAYNGTGTTSPTLNQIMFGNGASGLKVIGFGSSGQFLTSGGNGSAPSWTTAALDTAQNFTWSGINVWNSTTTLNATTSIRASASSPLVLNGATTTWPNTQGASSTVLTTDASGNLYWMNPEWYRVSSTDISVTANSTSSAISIPAKNNIWIVVHGTVINTLAMEINADNTGAYSYANFTYAGAAGRTETGGKALVVDANSTAGFANIFLENRADGHKMASWTSITKNGTSPPTAVQGYGGWFSNTQVSSVKFASYGGGTVTATVDVYASRN